MTLARLNRLFAADGRCFDVAIDHGLFNEGAFLPGIEDIAAAVRTVVDAGPDAVQLSPGQAPHLQAITGPAKPALVLRTDVANVYAPQLPRVTFSELVEDAVAVAVRLDAACVVVNLLLMPDEPELHRACVRNVTALRAACDPVAMPLMVEPLAMRDGYAVDGDVEKIVPLVRQAVELGADVIKADPTDDLAQYHRVVEAAGGRPLLVRGGGRVGDDELLARTRAVIEQGASGIVYGRNVIQHRDPAAITRALMDVVHGAGGRTEARA
jgi:fructose-bisphosphate aldolase, class I